MSARKAGVIAAVAAGACLLVQVLQPGGVSVDGVRSEADATLMPDSATLPSGAAAGIRIDTPASGARLPSGPFTVTGEVGTGIGTPVPRLSLMLTLDVSESAVRAMSGLDCGGDRNGDGRDNTVLDCEVAAAQRVIERARELGSVGEIGLAFFEKRGAFADLSPALNVQPWVGLTDDVDGNGVADVLQVVESLYWDEPATYVHEAGTRLFTPANAGLYNGGTSFGWGINATCQAMASAAYADKRVIFISDGFATKGPRVDDAMANCPILPRFITLAVGPTARCDRHQGTSTQYGFGTLQEMADVTGGVCIRVLDPSDLPDLVPQLLNPTVLTLTLTLDGGAPIDISGSADQALPYRGDEGIRFEHELDELDDPVELCVTAEIGEDGVLASVTDCVTVAPNAGPVADAGPDQEVFESEVVTLDGGASTDPDGDSLTYSWEVLGAPGPLAVATALDHRKLSFQALDDGLYELQLTVGDGDKSATDVVTVTVLNEVPTLTAELGTADAGGVVLVSARALDLGALDTHSLSVDWGDGSPTEALPAIAQGLGWASVLAGHAYDEPGTYPVAISLDDGDGGVVSTTLTAKVGTPVAAWAGSTLAPRTLKWSPRASGVVDGWLHSNRSIFVRGADKVFNGRMTYASTVDVGSLVVVPPPELVAAMPAPRTWLKEDYEPGGSSAIAAGSAFFDHTADCGPGYWQPVAMLAEGMHWVPCDVELDTAFVDSPITLAAAGAIRVSGDDGVLRPYVDGLVLLSGSAIDEAIDLVTTDLTLLGHVAAPIGGVDLDGTGNLVACGVFGDRIDLSGCDLELQAADCERPEGAPVAPTWVPRLSVTAVHDVAEAHPTEPVTTTATVTYEGAWLVLPGVIGVDNTNGSAAAVLDTVDLVVEQAQADGSWAPVVGPVFGLRSAADGTLAVGDPTTLIGGTSVPAGTKRWWTVEVLVDVSGTVLAEMLTPGRGLRIRPELVLSGAPARRIARFGHDLMAAPQADGVDISDLEARLATVDGEVMLFSSATAGMALMAPGESVVLEGLATSPIVEARRDVEGVAPYLARLISSDAVSMGGFAAVTATATGGARMSGLTGVASTARKVPALALTTFGPTVAEVGRVATWDLVASEASTTVASTTGFTHAVGVEVVPLTVSTTSYGYSKALAEWTPGPALQGEQLPVVSGLTWTDGAGNTYGPVGKNASVTVDELPRLVATLVDVLFNDVDGNGVPTPGDELQYVARISNPGSLLVAGVQMQVQTDPATTLRTSSLTTSRGTVVASAADLVRANVGTLLSLEDATITFVVELPAGSTGEVSIQADLVASGVAPFVSDDPGALGGVDPTVTLVVPTAATLVASLDDGVVIDLNGDSLAGEGDTVHYAALVTDAGLTAATGVAVTFSPDPASTLVAGSVVVSTGAVVLGNQVGDTSVAVTLGTVPSLSSAVVEFDVVVGPLGLSPPPMSVQGDVSGTNAIGVQTDDPATPAPSDATLTALVPAAGMGDDYEGPYPEITLHTPLDGARVAVPTDITATIAPTAGETLDTWRVVAVYGDKDLAEGVEVATGTGQPPTTLLGTFDPTQVPNGAWRIVLVVTDSAGLVGFAEVGVEVGGEFKPGRYQASFVDASYPLAVGELELVRVYDTLDVGHEGDFGPGWSLQLGDVQITTNGPLGRGGWGQTTCGGGLIFSPLCWTTAKQHFAVITWPDGTTEVHDFVPPPTSSFFPYIASPAFQARRPGSTLRVVGGSVGYFVPTMGDLYSGASANGFYDPRAFELELRNGTTYRLEVGRGLTQVVDRHGNTVVIGEDAIEASTGPDVGIQRDTGGRITRLAFADGTDVTYAYDGGTGDLATTTDRASVPTTYTYAPSPDHHLTSWSVNANTPVSLVSYDPTTGRVLQSVDPGGVTMSETSDLTGLTLTTIGPDPDLTTVEQYDSEGLLRSVTQRFPSTDDPGVEEVYSTQHDYDAMYRPTVTTLPTGATTEVFYDAQGRVLSSTDAAGVVTRLTYGPFDVVSSITVGGELAGSRVIDAQGRISEVRDALGVTTATFGYDSLGRMILATLATGETVVVDYGANGLPEDITLNGTDTVHKTYDAMGSLLTVTSPGTGLVEHVYDGFGRRVERIDERGRTQLFDHDDHGRLIDYTDKLGRSVFYSYDEAGRLGQKRNRNNEILAFGYDAAGRLAQVTGADVNRRFVFDPLGRLVRAELDGGAHVIERRYDAAGLVSERTFGLGAVDVTLAYTRDGAGRVTSAVGPDLDVTHAWDSRGRLGEISEATLGAFAYGYEPTDRVASLMRPDGMRTDYGYDPVGRVLSMGTVDAGGTSLYDLDFGYDGRGLLASRADDFGTTTYGHDVAGRLVTADHPGGSPLVDEVYDYDAAGRRTSWAGHPAADVVYSEGDQLLQDAVYSYVYDDEGQRTTRTLRADPSQVTTYDWNVAGQLMAVTQPDGSVWSYTYDGLDRRVRVVGPGYDEVMVYDGELARSSWDTPSGVMNASWLSGPGFGEVLAKTSAGRIYFPIRDQLQSPVTKISDLGFWFETPRDSYGVRATPVAGVDPYGFTGHAEDETGLVWGRARYLDPETGSWLSEDGSEDEPRYLYAQGSPLTMVDPTGFAAEYTITVRQQFCTAANLGTPAGGMAEVSLVFTEEALAHAMMRHVAPFGAAGSPFYPRGWTSNTVMEEARAVLERDNLQCDKSRRPGRRNRIDISFRLGGAKWQMHVDVVKKEASIEVQFAGMYPRR